MGESVILFKIMPYVIYTLAIFVSCSSGILLYHGLSNQTERVQTRLRFRRTLNENWMSIHDTAKRSVAEKWLKKAGYPLKLNSFSYHLILFLIVFASLLQYVVIPFLTDGNFPLRTLVIVLFIPVFLLPASPLSAFVFVMKRLVEYQDAKRNSEIFMLYDLIINELDMMNTTRINSYNLLKSLLPYFRAIKADMAKCLIAWSSDVGPQKALEEFGKSIGSKEAKALLSVIKSLDELDTQTALTQLKNMHTMFTRAQIENHRRRRKVTTDILGLPIKVTHFLIILNFILVIITMVQVILKAAR